MIDPQGVMHIEERRCGRDGCVPAAKEPGGPCCTSSQPHEVMPARAKELIGTTHYVVTRYAFTEAAPFVLEEDGE